MTGMQHLLFIFRVAPTALGPTSSCRASETHGSQPGELLHDPKTAFTSRVQIDNRISAPMSYIYIYIEYYIKAEMLINITYEIKYKLIPVQNIRQSTSMNKIPQQRQQRRPSWPGASAIVFDDPCVFIHGIYKSFEIVFIIFLCIHIQVHIYIYIYI